MAVYDLKERTQNFGIAVIRFASKIPMNREMTTLIHQFIKSGTSIGANYHEADDAESKDDFKHKLSICKKEASETRYWLNLIAATSFGFGNEIEALKQEAKELHLIFHSIIQKLQS